MSVIKKVQPEGSVFSKKSRYSNGYAVFSFSSISSIISFGFLNLPFCFFGYIFKKPSSDMLPSYDAVNAKVVNIQFFVRNNNILFG